MTNTPIPTGPSLLGAWFFDERFYDSGRDRVTPLTPVGYSAELKNGVTVGVEGDPSRDFGAADFDEDSVQFADVDADGEAPSDVAICGICSIRGTGSNTFASKEDVSSSDAGWAIRISNFGTRFSLNDNGTTTVVDSGVTAANDGQYISLVCVIKDGDVSIYINGVLKASKTGVGFTNVDTDIRIGESNLTTDFLPFNGEIAAVARYDLTVPNAPEPSEIARRWDRLTDIPATR